MLVSIFRGPRRRVRGAFSRFAVGLWFSWACVLGASCADGEVHPRTQVMVVVSAQAQVAKRLRQLEVDFYGGEPDQEAGWKKAEPYIGQFKAGAFEPVQLALVPADPSKPGAFRVEARALDGKQKLLLRVDVTSGYVQGRTLQLDVLLRDACLLPEPENGCSALRVDPTGLPELDGGAPAGPGTDAALDAMPGDAESDASVDAAMPDANAECQSDQHCADGDQCNGEERCESGRCVAGETLVCDQSDNVCVTYMCLPKKGCVELLHNGDDCNDDDACTLDDACQGGMCKGEALQCGDHEVCAAGSCGCEDGFEDCGAGACEEVGTRCECGGTWMCGVGARVCADQRGQCAGQLGETCAGGDCPDSCLLNQGKRCEQDEENTACNWSVCLLGIL